MAIRKIFELIQPALNEVEQRIRAQAQAFDPAVEPYVAYACESNGKRLRPALALLAGGATGEIRQAHIEIAAIVELIHAATLVHDDIMDHAEIRRGQPTPNSRWGNSLSVLLGDSLFAHALKLSTDFADNTICQKIALASRDLCTGEILQTQRKFDLALTLDDYYKIIELKTAALFGVAAELAAAFNQATPQAIAALKNFGQKLGIVYQIYDDCLDIAGNELEAGKTLGTDLRKGKLTLPIIHLLQNATAEEHQQYSEQILRNNDEDCEALSRAVRENGSLTASAQIAQTQLRDAQQQLEILPHNAHTQSLIDLADLLGFMIEQFIR